MCSTVPARAKGGQWGGAAAPITFSLQTQAQPQRGRKKINYCSFWFKKQNSKFKRGEKKKEQISRNNSNMGPEGSLVVER